jgi:hypothetical protein
MFSLQQNWRRGQNRFCLEAGWEQGWGELWEDGQTMYTYVSKSKNNKIKGERKKIY